MISRLNKEAGKSSFFYLKSYSGHIAVTIRNVDIQNENSAVDYTEIKF